MSVSVSVSGYVSDGADYLAVSPFVSPFVSVSVWI